VTTSGTATTNFDFTEIAEEAYERCGKELRTGFHLRSARRSLNLLMMDWANRGINLWTVEEGSIPMVVGTATYDLPADTTTLLEVVLRENSGETGQSDYTLNRLSASSFAQINNKNTQGRPLQFWEDRQIASTVTVWPVPKSADQTLIYWRLRRIEDVSSGGQTADVPYRFLPALISGLAYQLSYKIPEAIPLMGALQAEYETQFERAADEDREKADFRITPYFGR
tara:strand:+ start:11628 stop:12305 length:678 start_codon:yes stop_codon:yes gene_type:complete